MNFNDNKNYSMEEILNNLRRITQDTNSSNEPLPNYIKIEPVRFVRDIPKEWDVTFLYTGDYIGVIEELPREYLYTDETGREISAIDLEDLVIKIQESIDLPTRH